MKTKSHSSIYCTYYLMIAVAAMFINDVAAQKVPALTWADVSGGTGEAHGVAIVTDATGNSYVLGDFDNELDLDPGAGVVNVTSNGDDDIFIIKLDAAGNYLWGKAIGGTQREIPEDIAVDAQGNCYIVGEFSLSVDFDPGAATTTLTSAGSDDAFILKLDKDGNFTWAKRMGTTSGDYARAIVIHPSGFVFTVGYFFNTVDFDPGVGVQNFTAIGNADIFISKLDLDGNYVKTAVMGAGNRDIGTDIALDSDGNVYTTGDFNAQADFDPGVATVYVTGISPGPDVFLSKLDVNLNYVWAKNIVASTVNSGVAKHGLALTIDQNNNVHTTGHFFGTADFDPGAGEFLMSSLGGSTLYISKFDKDGNFQWAKQVGGTSAVIAENVTTDDAGNNYTTGKFSGTVDFDPGPGVRYMSGGPFILKLDANGDFVWSTTFDTGLGAGADIVINGGEVYATGSLYDDSDFDPMSCSAKVLGAAGNYYVWKLHEVNATNPTISSFSPTNGNAGTEVVITGTNFSVIPTDNVVTFNNQVAVVTASTATTITTSVPDAATTGKIKVTVYCKSVTSAANFTVGGPALPTITSFTPISGPVATQVTITGTNFSATPASNIVMFNGTTAAVTASTTTSITTSVPAGATTGKITVTVSGNTATSASNFTVSTSATITVTKQPQATTVCVGATATLEANATGTTGLAYQWQFSTSLNGAYTNVTNNANYAGATTNTLDVMTANAFGAGFYRCEVSGNNAANVFSDKAQLTIDNSPSCSNTPPQLDVPGISITIGNIATVALPALITDTEGNIDLSTLKIKTMPASGAHAFIDDGYNLVIDYTGVAFKGTDMMAIEVCDDEEECTEQEITIDVSGDIVVYNAVSPNNDGKNEIVFLQYVDMLPSTMRNKVTIYSRWGVQVFEITDYNNTTRVFRGLNDNGEALPTGTYFYRIDFPDEQTSKTGFISLRK